MNNLDKTLNPYTEIAAEAAKQDDATAATINAHLALAHETRTLALVNYYATLNPGRHHEQQHAAAILSLIESRLGLKP